MCTGIDSRTRRQRYRALVQANCTPLYHLRRIDREGIGGLHRCCRGLLMYIQTGPLCVQLRFAFASFLGFYITILVL